MTRSTGTIYEVLCPFCQKSIKHLSMLKRVERNALILCKKCGQRSVVEEIEAKDPIWTRITLVDARILASTDSMEGREEAQGPARAPLGPGGGDGGQLR